MELKMGLRIVLGLDRVVVRRLGTNEGCVRERRPRELAARTTRAGDERGRGRNEAHGERRSAMPIYSRMGGNQGVSWLGENLA